MTNRFARATWLTAAILLFALPAPATEVDLATRLKAIHFDYSNREQPIDIAVLVKMDQELRHIAVEAVARGWDQSHTYLKEGYAILGLYLDHWNGALQYSGQLLRDAHEQDPESKYRNHTLFSATKKDRGYGDSGTMPDIDVAYQYIVEFPDGPFISEVYELLATFYDDYYKSLRRFMFQKIHDGDTYLQCFKPYMTEQPNAVQLTQVQALSHHFYEKALASAGENTHQTALVLEKFENFKTMLGAARKDRHEWWYWCSDC